MGPGIVIMQNGHTVYVAVRSRLWKCNTDQLRPASQTEEMAMQVIASRQYRDLLGQMQKQRSGAVDVEREGAPPPEAWQQPVQRSEEAATLSMPPPPPPPEREDEEQGAEERRAALRAAATRQGPIRPIPEGRTNAQVLGPRGLPQMTREEVRRGSHSTVSEPASEPRAAGPAREAEDTEGKRRRILSPLREENRNRGNQTAGTREERTIQTGHEPSRGVRDRVEDIETGRIRDERVGTRRSRSPLPFTIRQAQNREDREAEERGDAPGARAAEPEPGGDDNLYSEGTTDQRTRYKESCRACLLEGCDAEGREGNGATLIAITGQSGNWAVQEPARNGEITWSQMTPEEIQKFKESDLQEWRSLEDEFKAVKVWRGEQAQELRRRFPNRIMTARVVRRKKPVPGLHQYKPKSRFCVHGHKDPDGGCFRTFAPTPSAEAFAMVCQVVCNLNMQLQFADVKAAFAQSNALVRPQGRLFVKPCDGTPLHDEDLIELVSPVYGLDDAPIRWYETVSGYLKSLGYKKALLDGCIYTLHRNGVLRSLILLEVDDFCIASADEEMQRWTQEMLQKRFKFGKWAVRGRLHRPTCEEDR